MCEVFLPRRVMLLHIVFITIQSQLSMTKFGRHSGIGISNKHTGANNIECIHYEMSIVYLKLNSVVNLVTLIQ